MKSNLKKVVLSIVLISQLGIGCKKDSVSLSSGQSGVKKGMVNPLPGAGWVENKFTVTSDTFEDGIVDHEKIKDLKSPQLSWKNVPLRTKSLLVAIYDGVHGYWSKSFENTSNNVVENAFGSYVGFQIPKTPTESTEVTIEIFALSILPEELNKLCDNFDEKYRNSGSVEKYNQSGQRIREAFKIMGISNHILGSAKATYKIKK